jgi:hypothetical protein
MIVLRRRRPPGKAWTNRSRPQHRQQSRQQLHSPTSTLRSSTQRKPQYFHNCSCHPQQPKSNRPRPPRSHTQPPRLCNPISPSSPKRSSRTSTSSQTACTRSSNTAARQNGWQTACSAPQLSDWKREIEKRRNGLGRTDLVWAMCCVVWRVCWGIRESDVEVEMGLCLLLTLIRRSEDEKSLLFPANWSHTKAMPPGTYAVEVGHGSRELWTACVARSPRRLRNICVWLSRCC